MDGAPGPSASALRPTAPSFEPDELPLNDIEIDLDDLNIDDILSAMGGDSHGLHRLQISEKPPNKTVVLNSTADGHAYTLVSTKDHLANVIDILARLPTNPPSIAIDIEGINLSRYGTISIITIHAAPRGVTFLIDVFTLGELAFTTPGVQHKQTTLKVIFENPVVPIILFDVRNDNDALVNIFGIHLKNVIDVQLMELACRDLNRTHVASLVKSIENAQILTPPQMKKWHDGKRIGKRLFASDQGGHANVFNERPLRPEIAEYCVQDVVLLGKLWLRYNSTLNSPGRNHWRVKIRIETINRLSLANDPGYDGLSSGRQKTKAPPGWPQLGSFSPTDIPPSPNG
ncbi:hypothetical protein TWF281_004166 [Arthrobotrys megalospora]